MDLQADAEGRLRILELAVDPLKLNQNRRWILTPRRQGIRLLAKERARIVKATEFPETESLKENHIRIAGLLRRERREARQSILELALPDQEPGIPQGPIVRRLLLLCGRG